MRIKLDYITLSCFSQNLIICKYQIITSKAPSRRIKESQKVIIIFKTGVFGCKGFERER